MAQVGKKNLNLFKLFARRKQQRLGLLRALKIPIYKIRWLKCMCPGDPRGKWRCPLSKAEGRM